MIVFGFGWAKPVPINTRYFRNPKRGMALSAIAGPAANLLLGLFFAMLFGIFASLNVYFAWIGTNSFWVTVADWASNLFYIGAQLNLFLMVFNLLPVPPLDGSRLWSSLLPGRWAYRLEQYSRYITMILFVALMSGVLDMPLWWLRYGVGSFIGWMLGVPNLFFLG